ncbi:gamma carbonic anhydrase family protein [Psychrosphaera saromensis]|uniref:Gamma carbonic anhydrase family protein n=1 Tax=Psychrosphaera saromensis TaxID=716813 RepID=A0A2S7UZ45_9GAMM|nr:gamma carbonic anhydrase family protein [Psychrosphaera saromensis]PQJ54772.1 gamma carbonic anhydrase family protein [Psychrosphaera saromensis]GHB57275.1 gamma carbonic anhydrase family protein [Psychrosphaera saromensis]GLQ13994.1 gamma carbonic anhydrase family protein [Psychrosphaera saromensis]
MLYQINGKKPESKTESYFIANSADVIGEVNLGDQSSIWFQCVLRADNAAINIGDNTNIQDGCVLHVDADFPINIGTNVTVGHKVMLHGCRVGNNSLIGMGATILNGAVIGDNCIIGAGSLITENKNIPDNSLVMGVPGKVVKQISPDQAKLLTQSALHYVEKAKLYDEQLQPLR